MTRILVVDDEEAIRGLLRKLLEKVGYKVATAANGREAISLHRSEPADLIITDILMPEKEGIQTIYELRRQFSDLKFIAISGGGRFGPRNYLDLAGKIGADCTLAKPLDPKQLLEAVRGLVGKGRVSAMCPEGKFQGDQGDQGDQGEMMRTTP